MHTRSLAPTAVVAALMTLLVIAAAIVTRGDGSEPVPAVVPAATPEPDGAEEWMYLQRANADGTIPDAAVNEAISQSKAMGKASQGSPATDQVWAELGPSNIGGRLRDDRSGSHDAGRGLHRHGLRRPLEVHRRRRDARTACGLTTCRSRWARSQSTPKGVVWAGTGELDHGGGSAYYGNGIYKSTDGGATWTNMGLEDGDTVGEIVIDPRNDNRVFVAVQGALHDTLPSRGLFMTEDGGATWTRVLAPRDHHTPAPSTWPSTRRIPTSCSRRRGTRSVTRSRVSTARTPTSTARSTAATRGRTSTTRRSRRARPTRRCRRRTTSSAGWASTSATATPNRAYLISSTARGNFNGFFTSTDAGATWTPIGSAACEQPAADRERRLRLVVRPRLRRPGEPAPRVRRRRPPLPRASTAAPPGRARTTPHADQHGLEFDPFTAGQVYLGNDGGFYQSLANGAAHAGYGPRPRACP